MARLVLIGGAGLVFAVLAWFTIAPLLFPAEPDQPATDAESVAPVA